MSTDWKALCAELADTLTKYQERLEEDYHPDRPEAKELDAGFRVLERARAALAQPEPVGPTDEELDSVFHEHCWADDDLMDHDDFVKAARAVLQRWGRPTITPIPVSERLPGAEDCAPKGSDAVGCCWLWEPDINGHDPLGAWKLEHRDWASDGDATHWLPFHALPLPSPNCPQQP